MKLSKSKCLAGEQDEELNLELCKVAGWTDCHKTLAAIIDEDIHERAWVGLPPNSTIHKRMPNYLSQSTGLSLLHELENRMPLNPNAERARYLSNAYPKHLCEVCGFSWIIASTATTHQRAVAILLTLKPELFL